MYDLNNDRGITLTWNVYSKGQSITKKKPKQNTRVTDKQ